MLDKTDEMIVEEVQRGDTQAFGELVSRYEEKIMRYAGKFLSEIDDRKDVVQEAFIKAYANIQGFDAKRRFSPWIYRIAHNEFVNALAKKSKIPTISFDPDLLFPHPVAAETADGNAARREMREMLDMHLANISPKYREPLVLYYFEDMDYSHIAEVLEIPVSTVGVRLNRGKAILKELMHAHA